MHDRDSRKRHHCEKLTGILAFWPAYLLAFPLCLQDSLAWKIAIGLLSPLAAVPCACAWHRRIIADEPVILTLSLAALFLSIMAGIFAATIFPHWSTPLFFIVPGFVATCWLVAPMFLGLPAAALGHRRSAAQLDAAAAPHRFKLTVLTMLIPTLQSVTL